MTSTSYFLSPSIQNIQNNLRDIRNKSKEINEINSITDFLDRTISNIILESRVFFDISLKPGFLQLVTDLLINMVENYGEYIYTHHGTSWIRIKKEWHLLKEQIECLRRKSDLVLTNDKQVFIGAIKWMTENGSVEDLEVLKFARQRKDTDFWNDEMSHLLEYCRQRIREKHKIIESDPDLVNITISDFLSKLRTIDKSSPLTYLIHGWGGPSANNFLRIINSKANNCQRDSFCLLKTSEESDFQEIQEVYNRVFLDVTQNDDLFFYNHAKRDLIYFPASEKNERTLLPKWQNRARVVVLDNAGFYTQEMICIGKEHGLQVYVWDGSSTAISKS